MEITTQKAQKPILFSASMVLALLSGIKNQTRRVLKTPGTPEDYVFGCLEKREAYTTLSKGSRKAGTYAYFHNQIEDEPVDFLCPYGNIGDFLWVRESFYPKHVKGGLEGFNLQYPGVCPWVYRADNPEYNTHGFGWKPSIHLPMDAARIFLKITGIKIQRLQDISEAEAKGEGVNRYFTEHLNLTLYECYQNDYTRFGTAYNSFQSLWVHLNGPFSWNLNPWVWVIEFEILSITGHKLY